MDYEPESPYKADSPFSHDVEEGELSSGPGRFSPGTIRDNASECGTQTDDHVDIIHPQETVTTMRVEVKNTRSEQFTQTALNQQTPQEIARIISEKVVKPQQSDAKRNQESFRTRKPYDITEQTTNTITHSYQSNRPQIRSQNNSQNDIHMPPPLPNYPPPVRPPPPEDYTTDINIMQQRVQQRWFERNFSHIRPHNLRFPFAKTPRSNNKKSFFHQSTNEQLPTATVMETIWFQEKDPRTLNNPHSSNYNPFLSYRNWSEMPFESKNYNFVIAPLYKLKDRISEYFPPLPSKNTNTVKRSTKNRGWYKFHQAKYPILKQFYSLTERFLYDYNYEFKVPVICTFDHLVAKASQHLSADSVSDYEVFQLSFNFLHPTPKDVENNNYREHETKLIHNLIYYTFFRDKEHYTDKSHIHINNQLTSPYFLNYGYKLKWEYTHGTLRKFDTIKNYYIFQSKDSPERPLMVPLEALQPCE